jgi:hypothetical protein
VYPGAPSYDVIADSSHRVVGVPIDSRVARIAHAWSLQSPQFVAGIWPSHVRRWSMCATSASGSPPARHSSGRDDRTPMVVADTVYWAVDLYSASDWYPLSISIQAWARMAVLPARASRVVDGSAETS